VTRHFRQPIKPPRRPAIFDRHVLAFDETGFGQLCGTPPQNRRLAPANRRMKKAERPEERVLSVKGEDFRDFFTEYGVGMRRRDCLGVLGRAAFARPRELTTSAKQTTLRVNLGHPDGH
jgi:hypothetical protein